MDERCIDCKPALMCENLNKEVESLKVENAELKVRIGKVETAQAVNEEQTKMVFKILNEIKQSIDKIANKIDEIESRPSKLLWGVLGTLAGAIIMAGIKFIGK